MDPLAPPSEGGRKGMCPDRRVLVETRQEGKWFWGLGVQLEVFTSWLYLQSCTSLPLPVVPNSPKSRGCWVQSLWRINTRRGGGVGGHSLL